VSASVPVSVGHLAPECKAYSPHMNLDEDNPLCGGEANGTRNLSRPLREHNARGDNSRKCWPFQEALGH